MLLKALNGLACHWCLLWVVSVYPVRVEAQQMGMTENGSDPMESYVQENVPIVPPGVENLSSPLPLTEDGLADSEPDQTQPRSDDAAADEENTGVSFYVLSRGKGVPDEAKAALDQFREFLEEKTEEVLDIHQAVIGLEGERRICVTFRRFQDAEEAFEAARRIAQGIDLVQVKMENCITDN